MLTSQEIALRRRVELLELFDLVKEDVEAFDNFVSESLLEWKIPAFFKPSGGKPPTRTHIRCEPFGIFYNTLEDWTRRKLFPLAAEFSDDPTIGEFLENDVVSRRTAHALIKAPQLKPTKLGALDRRNVAHLVGWPDIGPLKIVELMAITFLYQRTGKFQKIPGNNVAQKMPEAARRMTVNERLLVDAEVVTLEGLRKIKSNGVLKRAMRRHIQGYDN